MLRLTHLSLSNAFQPSNAFVKSALELVKLQYAHKAAVADRELKIAEKIEDAFQNELYEFRPLFTIGESVKVGKAYNKQIYGALRYFGMNEDPLARQLEAILGKQQRKKGSKIAIFKGVSPAAAALATGRSQRDDSTGGSDHLGPLRQPVITYRESERPLPREEVYSASTKSPYKGDEGFKKNRSIADAHRGHWVLQDADLKLSKEDKEVEPW